jgi:hypothetical protein
MQEVAVMTGKGNGFAVVGTHALGVGIQRALGNVPTMPLALLHLVLRCTL